MQDDLCWLSATDAAARIREGVLSPIAYTEAILARVDALQPRLNCFATVVADRARAAAHAAEAAVQKGAKLGPLHGVPVHIKDLFDTAGITTAHGSAVHATNVPARDNILVARLKAAGAIVMGKTTTPEFGHKGITDSPVYGITRNPWNTDCAAGGSSGGAASAVASGQGPLGLGTDGAGSIRIPASTCIDLRCRGSQTDPGPRPIRADGRRVCELWIRRSPRPYRSGCRTDDARASRSVR